MHDRNPLSPYRCTVRMAVGRGMCGRDTMRGTPFPICKDHARRLYAFLLNEWPQRDETAAERELAELEEWRERGAAQLAAHKAEAAKHAVVYYVRIHDFIKIGTTTQLRDRMKGLRVDDPAAVLAIEPGSHAVEKLRHKQFAAERIGKRENFRPTDRLLAHIAAVRTEHGLPDPA